MKTPHTQKRHAIAINIVYATCMFLVLLNVFTCFLVIFMYKQGVVPAP